jgi:hypothetical protein
MIINERRKTRAQIEKRKKEIGIEVTTEIIKKGERAVSAIETVVIDHVTATGIEIKIQKIETETKENAILHLEETVIRIEIVTVETKTVQKNEESTEGDQEAALEIETVQLVKAAAVIDEVSGENLTSGATNHICIGTLRRETVIAVTMKNLVTIAAIAKTAQRKNLKKAPKRTTFPLLWLAKSLTARK